MKMALRLVFIGSVPHPLLIRSNIYLIPLVALVMEQNELISVVQLATTL